MRFKGVTDPCIVDRESEPILRTEVKSKEEVADIDDPNRQHRTQVHAYMRSLAEKHDREIDEAVVIYGSRKTLDLRAYTLPFDDAFWQEVVEWAADHTAYREQGELPPGNPEYGWECRYCDCRHRCGQSDEPYLDEEPRGFLPDLVDYPREQVVEYLQAHEDAALTPALGHEYPDLAVEYGVMNWMCPRCETEYRWDSSQLNATSNPPVCPACADGDELTTLDLLCRCD
ncbi:hypothetical protein [Halorubellus litoreus]|uniref:Dna2/Cas4 domain-containing protein n=1 Tax=Halorubellus litoreus TaxID=755308 RepID=A0ABD5VD84_9EURY